MSIVYAELTLTNALDVDKAEEGLIKAEEIRQMTVQAMVDTGAWTIVINEETREKLGLRYKGYENGTRVNFTNSCGVSEVDDADGTKEMYKMAGPLEIWWKNRRLTCDALVIPGATETLLGAWVLEGLDLTINPKRELVGVHGDIIMRRV